MSQLPTQDIVEVKKFWDSLASDSKIASEAVTHRDHQQRLLEMHLTRNYLHPSDRLLDVGCGNGYATADFAPLVSEVLGVDYLPSMIERARAEFPDLKNVKWDVQDATKLTVPAGSFDVAITLRCIINLASWEAQKQSILEIHKALRTGGLFLMGEGTRQGRAGLNRARQACGLAAMPSVAYNIDFDEDVLWPFVREHFDIVTIHRFGVYDLVSRVIHPLLVSPEEPRYDAKINEIGCLLAKNLEGFHEVGREFLAVLKKK
jgi:SAM-dependent methyltransferase